MLGGMSVKALDGDLNSSSHCVGKHASTRGTEGNSCCVGANVHALDRRTGEVDTDAQTPEVQLLDGIDVQTRDGDSESGNVNEEKPLPDMSAWTDEQYEEYMKTCEPQEWKCM